MNYTQIGKTSRVRPEHRLPLCLIRNWKTSPTSAGKRPSTVRALELQRLDDLYTKSLGSRRWRGQRDGDRPLAFGSMERRSKLLGLDACLRRSNMSGDLVINLRSVDMGVPDE